MTFGNQLLAVSLMETKPDHGIHHLIKTNFCLRDTTRQTSEAALNASTLHLEMDMPDVNAMMDYAMRNAGKVITISELTLQDFSTALKCFLYNLKQICKVVSF